MTSTSSQTSRVEPVKIVIERRVEAASQATFERWIRDLIDTAKRSQALQGSSVLTAGGGEYFILLRFASQADLDLWQSSPEVARLLREAEELATAPDHAVVQSGLETWFTLPGTAAALGAPPKWKMALVTWLALLPQVIGLSFIVPKDLPFPLGMAVSTAIPVAMLAWVIMPRLTRLLHPWLYRSPAPQASR